MKFKIAIDLPAREKLCALIIPHDVHPQLARDEQTLAERERELESRRRDLVERERQVAEMPARIQRGDARASALTDALRERDGAAHMIAQAERAVDAARTRVATETSAAKAAVDREFTRRVELLEAAAAQVGPMLVEINEMARELAAHLGWGAMLTSISWPSSPADEASRRGQLDPKPVPLAYAHLWGPK